jgi:hypothetical protein
MRTRSRPIRRVRDEFSPRSPPKAHTTLQRQILNTLHPLERLGRSGELSAVQKAITLCISLHNGCASEQVIVDFLSTNWKDIQSISKHEFHQEPGMRLLHVNTHVKKGGEFLFLKVPPDSLKVNDLGILPENLPHNSSESHSESKSENDEESEEEDVNESEKRSESTEIGDLAENSEEEELFVRPAGSERGSVIENPAQEFECRLFELIQKADVKGIEEKVIVEEAVSFANAPGDFEHLELPRRVRAALLTMKLAGKIFWDKGAARWTREPVRKTPEILYRLERDFSGADAPLFSIPEIFGKPDEGNDGLFRYRKLRQFKFDRL